MTTRVLLACVASSLLVGAAIACSSGSGTAGASGSAGSGANEGGGGAAQLPTVVSSEASAGGDVVAHCFSLNDDECDCLAEDPDGTAPTTIVCEAATDRVCCEEPTYPAAGRHCGCVAKKKWYCDDLGAGSCDCGYAPSSYTPKGSLPSGSCSTSTTAGVLCCASTAPAGSDLFIDVNCSCDPSTTCPTGMTEVTSCRTASAARVAPPSTACTNGNYEKGETEPTTTCSVGPSASTPSDGGSGSACKNPGWTSSTNTFAPHGSPAVPPSCSAASGCCDQSLCVSGILEPNTQGYCVPRCLKGTDCSTGCCAPTSGGDLVCVGPSSCNQR